MINRAGETSLVEAKIQLRQTLRSNPAAQRGQDRLLSEHVHRLLRHLSGGRLVLGVYVPIQGRGNEPVLSNSICDGLEVSYAWPRVAAKTMEYVALEGLNLRTDYQNESSFETNKYGIPEPVQGQVVVPDILLVPGLGFSRNGFRLGRGGGFYDRYLAEHKVQAIGVAYREQILTDVPVEPWDQQLDWLVDPQGIWQKNQQIVFPDAI